MANTRTTEYEHLSGRHSRKLQMQGLRDPEECGVREQYAAMARGERNPAIIYNVQRDWWAFCEPSLPDLAIPIHNKLSRGQLL